MAQISEQVTATRQGCVQAYSANVQWYLPSYKKNLSLERRRLLSWCQPAGSQTEEAAMAQFMDAMQEQTTLKIATDGGLSEEGRGSFGVVVAVADTVIWECAGPVDGNPHTAKSKRSELTGYASSLETMLMITHATASSHQKGPLRTLTWINSSGALHTLNNMLQKKEVKDEIPT